MFVGGEGKYGEDVERTLEKEMSCRFERTKRRGKDVRIREVCEKGRRWWKHMGCGRRCRHDGIEKREGGAILRVKRRSRRCRKGN